MPSAHLLHALGTHVTASVPASESGLVICSDKQMRRWPQVPTGGMPQDVEYQPTFPSDVWAFLARSCCSWLLARDLLSMLQQHVGC